MKKILSIAMMLVLSMSLLAGCKKQVKVYTSEELVTAIENSGSEAIEYYKPITAESDDAKVFYDGLSFTGENYQSGAFALSFINIKAFAIAVVQPVEGKSADVVAEFETYVANIQKSFENYLQDQYAISKEAIVKELDNGVVVMVMCEDAQTVYDTIVANLEA